MTDNNLAGKSSIDHATMWRYMCRLVERLFPALEGEAAIDDALDILVDVLGADRGLVLLNGSDGSTRIVNARGHRKPLTLEEREEISRTVVAQALSTNQCVVWDPLASHSASESAMLLGIVAGLTAPLHGGPGQPPRGVVYVDFRDRRKFFEREHVEFFMSSANLLGAVLEQHARTSVALEHLRGAKTFFVESRRGVELDEILIGSSMEKIAREVASAIRSEAPILILGESGTGKTLLAHALAEASGRRPIVRALLGSSDDLNTITSELFGHEKGSFSGAMSRRVGLVEFASDGTLILDEVLNLPAHAQRLLLDFTQFGTYRPLGYDRPDAKRSNVRIIGATNGDLRTAMRDGRFRADLYHRLAGVVLELPPLRERRDEIPRLAEATLRRADPSRAWKISVPLRKLLVSASNPWEGNVRQLETVIRRARERALAESPSADEITPDHVGPRDLDRGPSDIAPGPRAEGEPLRPGEWARLQEERTKLDEREAAPIRAALVQFDGVVAKVAREFGVARTTLVSRMDALGIRSGKT
ncbi:hypothetical protein BH09MYX1_BH09MYX1_45160 [soil metagenome]